MPRREGQVIHLHELSIEERRVHDGRAQQHWYRHVAPIVAGQTVVDVGAGSGYGMDILREAGASVTGLDPLPLREDVICSDHTALAVWSCDYLVAMDVIEHVEDDLGFLATLLGAARIGVFVSTPNWDVSHCVNPHHIREYTLDELLGLIHGRRHDGWSSDGQCQISLGLNPALSNFGVMIYR